MSRVIIQLVSWNGIKYLPYLFASLQNQTFKEFDVRVWDNGSTDGTQEWLKEYAASYVPEVHITVSPTNIGFASGHNKLFENSLKDAEYVLLQNQDMQLEPTFLETLVEEMDARPSVGSCSGRLMKWAFPKTTNMVDSLCLRPLPNHRVIEDGGGVEWVDCGTRVRDVFGVSGALPLYRTEALRDVAHAGEVFDAGYFSYKEDVDLAWRLRRMGWGSITVLDAVAHHDRSAAAPAALDDITAAKNRSTKSALAKKYSYRNHLRLLIKLAGHEVGVGGWLATIWYEFKKAVFMLVVAPRDAWWAWSELMRERGSLYAERRRISAAARVPSASLRRWFTAV